MEIMRQTGTRLNSYIIKKIKSEEVTKNNETTRDNKKSKAVRREEDEVDDVLTTSRKTKQSKTDKTKTKTGVSARTKIISMNNKMIYVDIQPT